MNNAQDPYLGAPPNPDEVATIIAKYGGVTGNSSFAASGQQSGVFTDWEQVYVQIKLFGGHGVFRFLAVERDPMPTLWNRLQLQPGDSAAIYLGGQLAIAGLITIRQTAYDATTHGVMIQGEGWSAYASKTSVQGPQGGLGGGQGKDQGNFDNMNFQAVAEKVLTRAGIPFEFLPGVIDPIPFKKLQAEVGEIIFNFLERIARPRGVVIGSNQKGAMTFQGTGVSTPDGIRGVVDVLEEGVNILRMQAIWSVQENHDLIGVSGQTPGSDSKQGTDASEQIAWTNGAEEFKYSPHLTVAEQPVWNLAELQDRARNEARWINTSHIIVNVTVQGWMRSDGNLWRVNDLVQVNSPMAMLHDVLGVQTVTYQQDSSTGTTTTLELVLPERLGSDGSLIGVKTSDNPLLNIPQGIGIVGGGVPNTATSNSMPPVPPDEIPT